MKFITGLTLLLATNFASANAIDPQIIVNCAKQAGVITASERPECFGVTTDGTLYELHNPRCGGDFRIQTVRGSFTVQVFGSFAYLGYETGGRPWMMCSFVGL